ncbi:hypothetical protein FZN28_25910, partial [Escherichia coli]|nr:hypothetical protein [Escherichia coli]
RPKTSIICSPMTSLKTSIKTITYLSDTGCLEIQGASLTEIWIKAYLQLIHNTLGITETEKLVNLYNSFFTDKVVLWDESVKKVKWIYEK